MTHRTTTRHRIGAEAEPLITIDGFAVDPAALRAAAIEAAFDSADHHYPGLRAPLPDTYLRDQLPVIAQALGRVFGPCRRLHVVDARFSLVTTPPGRLDVRQSLPHVDAYGRERIALVHYLSLGCRDGTAFYRHRATGFETIDETRAPAYFDRLRAEVEDAPPTGYIVGDTPLFERTAVAQGDYNRAVLYRSYLLHSGDIGPDTVFSTDPAAGRLTITAFLAVE
ncbi:hypothetical protein ASE75_02620 [Sphingomonas sp. Leaf17]|uniref:DUF6445 family protein n=1 Tax=Sphingomonas sp. Leaf17 TaxID=1735683 RepID=UPI0006F1DD4C|nr:DUF6445 family protein [Sphingomonas sp. Leaf17]KQM68146.1 hypothetical protein ASE75_02620 [Sphingomonas sp. Leaf17]